MPLKGEFFFWFKFKRGLFKISLIASVVFSKCHQLSVIRCILSVPPTFLLLPTPLWVKPGRGILGVLRAPLLGWI